MTFGVVAVPFMRSFSCTVRVTSAPLLLPMRMSLMGRSAHPGATGPRNLRHGQDPPHSRLGPSSASLRINPDRLVFDTPPRFNASPYLVDPLLKSAYLDPYALLPSRLAVAKDEASSGYTLWHPVINSLSFFASGIMWSRFSFCLLLRLRSGTDAAGA